MPLSEMFSLFFSNLIPCPCILTTPLSTSFHLPVFIKGLSYVAPLLRNFPWPLKPLVILIITLIWYLLSLLVYFTLLHCNLFTDGCILGTYGGQPCLPSLLGLNFYFILRSKCISDFRSPSRGWAHSCVCVCSLIHTHS